MKAYQPISCDEHDKLELAVMHHSVLDLHLKGGRTIHGHPRNVYTQDGAEWLEFSSRDEGDVTIRLDEIEGIEQH